MSFLLAGGALLGGSILQGMSGNQKRRAAQRAIRAERGRQDEFDQQSFDNFRQALGGFSDRFSPEQRGQAVEGRTNLMRQIMDQGPGPQETPVAGPEVGAGGQMMRRLYEQGRENTQNQVMDRGQALARLGGMDDTMLGQRIGFARDSLEGDRIRQNQMRSAQIAENEIPDAYNSAGNFLGFAGNLLTTGGSLGLNQVGAGGDLSSLFR